MTYHKGLPGQDITLRRSKKQHSISYIIRSGKFTIDSVPEHDLPDDLLFADTQLFGLLGDLFIYQGSTDKPGANHICCDIMRRPLLGQYTCQPDQCMLGRHIRCLEY